MEPFRRRIYTGLGEFLADLRFLLARRPLIKAAMRSGVVSPAFRERLMLAVTQVNDCRYCRSYHAQEALKAGISGAELHSLLQGDLLSAAPDAEHVALLYAQAWAESNAGHEPVAWQRLVDTYGKQTSEYIQVILRMIRVGNLLGNTGDYWLYRLSFGRWGVAKPRGAK